ncbi:hypothetical protein PRIC2_007612 [Phytophthora ramorum]
MPASTTSSLSSRSSDKNSSESSHGSRRSSGSRDSKLLLRAASDLAEVAAAHAAYATISLTLALLLLVDCFGGVFNQLVDDYFSLQPQRKAFRRRLCFTSNFM